LARVELRTAGTLSNDQLTPLNPNSGEPGAGDTVADLVIGQNGFSSAAQCSKKRRESASVHYRA
jgi:hypothetical protein